jgi:hypothetical protein
MIVHPFTKGISLGFYLFSILPYESHVTIPFIILWLGHTRLSGGRISGGMEYGILISQDLKLCQRGRIK